jgi:hypothetical protein
MCNETHLGLTKRLEESEERVFSEFFVAVEVRPLQWRTFQLILQPDLLRVRSMVGAKKRSPFAHEASQKTARLRL